jgi:UDP-GlcNAc3NAcA epimerase
MIKIITIVGARPQFIKAAAISRAIAQFAEVEEKIVHTGQHYDPNMSDVFFDEMAIPKPHFNLGVSNGGHGFMTGNMMVGLESIMMEEQPDAVLVYGDTNSTLAGALVAAKLHIPIVHIEAGLRSFNMKMPEEINRILTDRVSSLLFCPTETAVHNLKQEGFDTFDCKIINSGDVMFDTVKYYTEMLNGKTLVRESLNIDTGNYVLCTIHRAENTNDKQRLEHIFEALSGISDECKVVIPVHPRTRKYIEDYQIQLNSNITILDPVGYFDMLDLLKNCKLVMTDSGGLQKEAFFSGKPCVTLRDETEWVELVENGYNTLSGAEASRIIEGYHKMKHVAMPKEHLLYGDGNAAFKIVKEIVARFSQTSA